MDLLRMFQMQGPEPVVRESVLAFHSKQIESEIEKLKQIIQEKDVIIENNSERMIDLETQVAELESQNVELAQKHCEKNTKYEELPALMTNYENLLSKILSERERIQQEKEIAQNHLANLELAFSDLLEKYERSKSVVLGFKDNENALMKQLKLFEEAAERLEQRYSDFKTYTRQKLADANQQINETEKHYIAEVAKLKATILQSKVKITELEKRVKNPEHCCNRTSMFEPLQNDFMNCIDY